MGIQLTAIQCPNCDTTYASGNGPNYTFVPAPTAPGWSVVLLSCMGCKQILGAYSFPQQT